MTIEMPGSIREIARCAIVCCMAIVLTGCAAKYQEMGVTGGFTDKMLSENTGVLMVGGNGFTSEAKVGAMLMLRASEMTLQSGHQRFSLLTIEDQAALDAQKAGRLPAYLRQKAAHGNYGPRLVTTTTRITVNGVSAGPIKKSGGGFFVVMYKAGEGGAYDARKLAATLKPKLAEADGETQSQ